MPSTRRTRSSTRSSEAAAAESEREEVSQEKKKTTTSTGKKPLPAKQKASSSKKKGPATKKKKKDEKEKKSKTTTTTTKAKAAASKKRVAEQAVTTTKAKRSKTSSNNNKTLVTAQTKENVPATPTKPSPSNKACSRIVTPEKKETTRGGGGSHPVDVDISVAGKNAASYSVHKDSEGLWYDAVLNQCNIGSNNNKYYRLQLLKDSSDQYYAWFRWGRVGEASRASSSTWMGPTILATARGEFLKKYRAKSGNAFGAEPFVPKSGKYKLIEIDNDVEVSDDYKAATPAQVAEKVEYEKSMLNAATHELMETIFSIEVRNKTLASFNLDLKRLPLGVPSQQQIQHGVSILTDIEDKLNGDPAGKNPNARETFLTLSSRFYTAIPHSFGRCRPPIISTKEDLQSRFDMCNILMDMFDSNETVRQITKREQQQEEVKTKLLPNPVDQKYRSLRSDLGLIDRSSTEFKVIADYFEQTKSAHSSCRLLNAWSVDRENEADRFAAFDGVGNRCLLWHGTSVAVAAPIITNGLRIMPHSGGRVGSGIYLAGMQQKSAQYTSGYGAKYACMFLCEAPLGRQHIVNQDGPHASTLKKSPAGFDSVHAVGQYRPSGWISMKLDGKDVKVPHGQAKDLSNGSSFYHDEFLVYDEAQVRIRYVVTVKL